jgi:hypothetical protein
MVKPFRAHFFHVNPRHHSMALIETGRRGFHDFMVELFSLVDVGQGFDIASSTGGRLLSTLGRHTNDHMTSFYTKTPSDFGVEYGRGGRLVDVPNHVPEKMTKGGSQTFPTSCSVPRWAAYYYAACATGSRYSPPRVISTHAIRAILLAMATAAILLLRRCNSLSNQGRRLP